jgi:hypothetical protein
LILQGNAWDNAAAHVGNAIDISRIAGTLNLTLSSNLNIESAANGVVIDGGSALSTNIVGFTNNTVHTDTVGAGIVVSNVTFDAVPGGGIDSVAGSVLTIGLDGNGVGSAGLTLTNVRGSLGFTDLDVYGTSGLTVTGDATVGVALTVVPPGSGGTSEAKGTSGAAVSISNAAINLQLAELASTFVFGGGVLLTNVSGTFSAPSGSTIVKNGGGGAAFAVNNSAAGTTVLAATYGGTITNASGTGGSVSIATADSGSSVSFTGAITDNPGTGISLTGNTGATVSFSGGLTLNGANSRFDATGGGTVAVTGTNTIGATTAPSGPALNVANTTIGASGLTFRTISANGGADGIVVNTTGSTAGLTVTGNGAAGTGGTIQNITNRGVSVVTAADISLSWMTFTNAATTNGADPTDHASGCGDLTTGGNLLCNAPIHLANVSKIGGDPAVTLARLTITNSAQVGINVNNVDGLSLTNTTMSGIGNQTREYGIKGRNLYGAVTFDALSISNSFGDHVRIDNNGAQATTLNVANSAFSTTTEGNGFVFNPNGTATTVVNIASSSFTSNFSTGLIIGPTQPTSGGTVTIDVTGGPFSNNNAGVQIFGNGTTDVTYDIHNIANISGNPAAGIQNDMSDQSQSTASLVGEIRSNTITMPAAGAGNGIGLTARGAGTSTVSVTSNTVTSRTQYGIHLHRKEGLAPGTLNATVTGNTVTTFDTAADLFFPIDSIRVEAGAASADTGTVCATISGNTATGAGSVPAESPGDDIRLRMRFTHTFQLPGLVGTDATAAINLLNTNNPASGSINATTTTNFTSVSSCPTPP